MKKDLVKGFQIIEIKSKETTPEERNRIMDKLLELSKEIGSECLGDKENV